MKWHVSYGGWLHRYRPQPLWKVLIGILGTIMAVLGPGSLAVGVFAILTIGVSDMGVFLGIAIGIPFAWIGITLRKHPNRSVWALGLGLIETGRWAYRVVSASADVRSLYFLAVWIGFVILALAAIWSIDNLPNEVRVQDGGA